MHFWQWRSTRNVWIICAGYVQHEQSVVDINKRVPAITAQKYKDEIYILYIFCTESIKTLRMYSKIVIPGNVGNHWVAIVVDFKNKHFWFCNSFTQSRKRDEMIAARVINYVSVLNIMKQNKVIDMCTFSISHLNDQPGFNPQTDTFSCGPYVCLMVKSILQGKSFYYDKNRARQTIINDIVGSCDYLQL